MDVIAILGFAFGMMGLVFGLQGMTSYSRIDRLETKLKELNLIETEFNSGSSTPL